MKQRIVIQCVLALFFSVFAFCETSPKAATTFESGTSKTITSSKNDKDTFLILIVELKAFITQYELLDKGESIDNVVRRSNVLLHNILLHKDEIKMRRSKNEDEMPPFASQLIERTLLTLDTLPEKAEESAGDLDYFNQVLKIIRKAYPVDEEIEDYKKALSME